MKTAHFRFYEELNDFLPPGQQRQTVTYSFEGNPGIKDPIEALGIPHPEIELIIVDGQSVGFDYQLRNDDRVAVYPMFESLDVTPLVRLRDKPLRRTTFILDVNLGKLARRLRLCGFDAQYRNDYSDRDVVDIGVYEHRIILTRDRRLLHHKTISHGYWVRSTHPDTQLKEVLNRCDLSHQVKPFHRCIECNGEIQSVAKATVLDRLEPLTKQHYQKFYRCLDCDKVYWKGSHYEHMVSHLSHLLDDKLGGERTVRVRAKKFNGGENYGDQ